MVYPYLAPCLSKEVQNGDGYFLPPESGLAVCETAPVYCPRNPEESILYGVVAAQLETFLQRQRRRDRPVPRFVERELRSFLECGVLAHGFLRVHCDACGEDRVVAFSCKGRAVCSSCGGRRMADTAAHLVDRVLPKVPVRQWVLSLPFALRYRLAYDARLVRDVLHIFVQVVSASLRRRARNHRGVGKARCGAVTFVQRFGGALNLNVHFHTLVLDGVYAADEGRRIRFYRLPPPENAEVARVTACIARRIVRLLEHRGLGPQSDPDEADPPLRDQPLLATLYGASVQGRIATGPRAGDRVTTLAVQVEDHNPAVPAGPRCASLSGISLHANVCIPAGARRQLEKFCRYVARPAVAAERLSLLPDGRLLSRQFILRRRSERFWIASASLPGPRRSHVRCRKTHTSQNDSEQAANPGVPYGKVVRKKFHADSINGRKMTDADWRGVAGAGAGG